MIEELKRRCERAAAEAGQGSDTALPPRSSRGSGGTTKRGRCEQDRRQLKYQAPNNERNADRLLHTHGTSRRRGLWATLHSMRNVEGTGSLRVRDWPPQ